MTLREGMMMTEEEKQGLVNRIADLAIRDVLNRSDMVEILMICKEACARRIRTLERGIKSDGVQ